MKRICFEIEKLPDLSAGIRGFYDTICIDIDSGDPGGEDEEFKQHIKQALIEGYDGAKVTEI